MISIDRKVCKDILKVTKDYNVSIMFSPDIEGYAVWHMHHPEKANQLSSVPVSEVLGALDRLSEKKLIKKIQGSLGGGMVFRITPELLHYESFWWDRVSKTYVAGFASGVLTTVCGGLLLHFLTSFF